MPGRDPELRQASAGERDVGVQLPVTLVAGLGARRQQSEFLQLLTFVVLTTFLIHRNSHESRDSDDQMQRSLDRIEKRLKALEGEGGKAKAGSSS